MKNISNNQKPRAKRAPKTVEAAPETPSDSQQEVTPNEASLSSHASFSPAVGHSELSVAEEMAQWSSAPMMEEILQAALKGLKFWMENGYSLEDAFERIHSGAFGSPREIAGRKPLTSFDWDDMRRIENAEVGSAEKMRTLMRMQARAEIKDGRRGARAVEDGTTTPMDEARYLALVDELSEDWNPRNGIERTLIEQMAQAHTQYTTWQRRLNQTVQSVASDKPKLDAAKQDWSPSITQSEAATQAANMADRYQRMFLRTQRALRDLRRHSVTIEHVDQLNMGEQQINISSGKREGI